MFERQNAPGLTARVKEGIMICTTQHLLKEIWLKSFVAILLWSSCSLPLEAARQTAERAGGSSLMSPSLSLDTDSLTEGNSAVDEKVGDLTLPPVPGEGLQTHVTDAAGLLSPIDKTRLEEDFQLLEKQNKIHLYLVTIDKSPHPAVEYALLLCNNTLPPEKEALGGVILLETPPTRITVALTAKARQLLPDDALAAFIDNIVASLPDDFSPGGLLATTGNRLAEHLIVLKAKRSDVAHRKNILILTGATLALPIMLAFFIKGFFEMQKRNLFDRKFTFPAVEVDGRFGGRNGGGHGAVMQFSRKD